MEFPIIKGLNRSLKSEDILTFYNKSSKQQNDEFNKIRECIIANVRVIPNFSIDEEYIEKWSYVYLITFQLLEDLSNSDNFEIVQKAGRKYNNDFELTANGSTYLIEFKTNSIPQIASIYCNNSLFCNLDYPRYFYDNYLKDIVGNNVQMIQVEAYMKDINKTKPELTDNPDFFRYLKELAGNHPAINLSIKSFLEANSMKLNLEEISHYLEENLTKKTFVLYNSNHQEYTVLDQMFPKDVKLLKIEPTILNSNTIIVYSETYEFKFLLRWKNHKGCLGPAWQISICRWI